MADEKSDFLYPRRSYYGQFSPKNLAFDANLQEFAQKVTYICALENNGKLPPEEAYKQIRLLWKELKRSKKALGIGDPPDTSPPPDPAS